MTAVEHPVNWRKSSRSQNTITCVEVGRSARGAAGRDTKDRAAGYLTVDRRQWRSFLSAIKTDRFS